MMQDLFADHTHTPPFETHDLRTQLAAFLDRPFPDPTSEKGDLLKVGNYKWGVYAFYDYDGEPIYVGQTNEQLRVRIRRHLTNQRTDAVAMSVLDPFEVREIEVWPLPAYQDITSVADKVAAKQHLNALEHEVFRQAIEKSQFKAILNEKDPPVPEVPCSLGPSLRGCIVSPEVHRIRSHPDFRIARRALIISRLAQVISERHVQPGLRRVLTTQAKRLHWLTERRYTALGQTICVDDE